MLTQTRKDGFGIGGVLTGAVVVPRGEEHLAIIRGVGGLAKPTHLRAGAEVAVRAAGAPIGTRIVAPDDCAVIAFGGKHNAFVNQGLQRLLDMFYEDTQASLQGVSHIGLSADAQAVTASTTSLDPAGGAAGTSIKTIDNVSRTTQTTHGDQTWTEADVTWAIRKIGLLYGSAATDVIDIIGGSGGSSPYDEDFTIDLTAISAWSLTMGIDVTATAS